MTIRAAVRPLLLYVAGAAVLLGAVAALLQARVASPSAVQDPPPDLVARTLEQLSRDDREADGAGPAWTVVTDFYEGRGHRLAWTDRAAARQVVAAIEDAAAEGLDPAAYAVPPLDELGGSRAVEADLRLSHAFASYGWDLGQGPEDPAELGDSYFTRERTPDVRAALERAAAGQVSEAVDLLRPAHPEYAALKEVLAEYRAIAAGGGWLSLPDDLRIEPGERSPHVEALRARLRATGDLPMVLAPLPGEQTVDSRPAAAAPAPPGQAAGAAEGAGSPQAVAADSPTEEGLPYDQALAEGVRRFQVRHGLENDGIVGPRTLAAMNVPVEERIQQIIVNIDRWRWMPDELGSPHIRVNIPGFSLRVVGGETAHLEMKVVAGTPGNPTPVMHDMLDHVVFNPYWNIPASIAANETVPAVRRDFDYLSRNHIEVVDEAGQVVSAASVDWSDPGAFDGSPYRLRQRSWTGNSLGQVKFMFPNRFNVYLHDTPADHLFERVERDFSHGCVRVSDPEALAHYLLGSDWPLDRIRRVMAGDEQELVPVEPPVSVHLIYLTTWRDADGTVQFREDLYGYDAAEMERRAMPPAGRQTSAP